jgi:hypothetical protein
MTVQETTWRLCPFCSAEPHSPCEHDCPSLNPNLKAIINSVRELLLLSEFLYKRIAIDLPMEERHRIEDTINMVFVSLDGIKPHQD